jgi:hypothetical protein
MTSTAASSFMYVDSDVPEGMTLSAWRHAKAAPARRRRLPGLPAFGPALWPRFVG